MCRCRRFSEDSSRFFLPRVLRSWFSCISLAEAMPSCGRSLATWEPFSQSFLLGFDIASLLLILEVFYFQVLELFADLLSIFPSTGSRFLAMLTCFFRRWCTTSLVSWADSVQRVSFPLSSLRLTISNNVAPLSSLRSTSASSCFLGLGPLGVALTLL